LNDISVPQKHLSGILKNMSGIPEVTPSELSEELKAGKSLYLLDVREANELEIIALEGIHHIPLGEVPDRFAEVPKDQDIVVICRSGGRSGKATEFLLGQGYTSVRNMVTGMNGWATTVDTTMSTY
jgi:sulfur-carrier protein adenylyltransferase/sulfurtransferase